MSTVATVTEAPTAHVRFRVLYDKKPLMPQWASAFIRNRVPVASHLARNKDLSTFRKLLDAKNYEGALTSLVRTVELNPSDTILSQLMNQLFLEELEPTIREIIDGNLKTVGSPERSAGWDHLYQNCSYTVAAEAGAYHDDEQSNGPKLEGIRTLLEQGKDHEALNKILEFNKWSSWVGPHVRVATFIPPLLRV